MKDTLAEICEKKRAHIAARREHTPEEFLRAAIDKNPPPRGFLKALKAAQGPALIAEVKKASPSKGVIRADFNPESIARAYLSAGAHCLSVLTDTPYFQGTDEDFKRVRAAVSLPMLRKDFMLEPYQIYESCALGADCVLLIMAALSDAQAQELYTLARELHMDVLVEVHDEAELERALPLHPMMIGVNNRSLKTLAVDVNTSHLLAARMPDSVYKISESGITDHEMILSLHARGYGAFLVGESLMKQPDIAAATKTLLKGY